MSTATCRRLAVEVCLRLALLTFFGLSQARAADEAPRSKAGTAAALLNGQPIFQSEVEVLAAPQLHALINQEYQIKKDSLESLILQKLLASAAASKGLTVDQALEREVDAKIGEPSEAELKAYYIGQQDRRPYSEIEPQLRIAFRQAMIRQARQDYMSALRSSATVTILMGPPRVDAGVDPARLRGKADAPVTIVEFSDYQCPYCQAAEGTLKELLARYEGRVRLAYRDFPLSSIHPQAQFAAEASRCAGDQGKYWEYHDALFANQSLLQKPALIESARKLGLDEKRFETCISDGKFRDAVQSDYQEGARAGVTGTPAFFIDGIYLKGNQPTQDFARIIDEELEAIARKEGQRLAPPGKEDALVRKR